MKLCSNESINTECRKISSTYKLYKVGISKHTPRYDIHTCIQKRTMRRKNKHSHISKSKIFSSRTSASPFLRRRLIRNHLNALHFYILVLVLLLRGLVFP